MKENRDREFLTTLKNPDAGPAARDYAFRRLRRKCRSGRVIESAYCQAIIAAVQQETDKRGLLLPSKLRKRFLEKQRREQIKKHQTCR